jgi:hypothetical protein
MAQRVSQKFEFLCAFAANTSGEKMPKFDNVCLPGDKDWRICRAGDSFSVPANSSFDIEPLETLDYVCHFG